MFAQTNGVCYRLYREQDFLGLPQSQVPEIQRCSLQFALLHLLASGQENVFTFEFMDPPDREASAYSCGIKYTLLMSMNSDRSNAPPLRSRSSRQQTRHLSHRSTNGFFPTRTDLCAHFDCLFRNWLPARSDFPRLASFLLRQPPHDVCQHPGTSSRSPCEIRTPGRRSFDTV